MQVGQKVVCVDDHFPKPLAKYYINLPVKNKVYTIRAVFLGRGVMHSAPSESDGEIGLLLQELVNGPDPRNKYQQELGFKAERFRPLRTMDTSTENEEELVEVRAAPKSEPLKALPLPFRPKAAKPESRATAIDASSASSRNHRPVSDRSNLPRSH